MFYARRMPFAPELLAPALLGSVLRPEFVVHGSTERRFGEGSEGIQQRKKCMDAALQAFRAML